MCVEGDVVWSCFPFLFYDGRRVSDTLDPRRSSECWKIFPMRYIPRGLLELTVRGGLIPAPLEGMTRR